MMVAAGRPNSDYERGRITALGGRLVEVHCACPLDVAARHYAERAGGSHPVHVVTAVSAEFLAEFDRPVGLGELIVVDTSGPVDIPALAGEVRTLLAAPV